MTNTHMYTYARSHTYTHTHTHTICTHSLKMKVRKEGREEAQMEVEDHRQDWLMMLPITTLPALHSTCGKGRERGRVRERERRERLATKLFYSL